MPHKNPSPQTSNQASDKEEPHRNEKELDPEAQLADIDKQLAEAETIDADNNSSEGPAQDSALSEVTVPQSTPPLAPAAALPNANNTASPHKSHKKRLLFIVIIIILLIAVAALLALPQTRYPILGKVIKKEVTIVLTDASTNKPVSGVTLSIIGQSAKTNAKGEAAFSRVPVGNTTLTATKKYYKNTSQSILVPLQNPHQPYQLKIEATGRQVQVSVTNKISGQPLENAMISAQGVSSTTGKDGKAVLVLPPNKPKVEAKVALQGYNPITTAIQVTEGQNAANSYALTPAGTIYFLSKRTGKIDVMKSNLDGSNQQVVLKGTGREEDRQTVLLASRDWKYLALKARRDSDKPKLYLIDTAANDKLSVIDEGDATFTPVGWSNHYFVYTVQRNNLQFWQPKHEALKSFDASDSKLTTLDETTAQGTIIQSTYEELAGYRDNTYILDNLVLYTKHASRNFNELNPELYASLHTYIIAVQPNGSNKRNIKDFQTNGQTYIYAQAYRPQEIYFQVRQPISATPEFYEFEDGKLEQLKDTKAAQENFDNSYPTFIIDPSGQKSFWSESRDGKNVLFIGDKEGHNEKEFARLPEMVPYGWYGQDYLLVSKNSSELYVMSRANPQAAPLKLTDYHKPEVNFAGYGYGYGGF